MNDRKLYDKLEAKPPNELGRKRQKLADQQRERSPFDRRPTPPPNYFSRREQYRLLVLCAMLMLVLVMMNEARKPETWKWMWRSESPSSPEHVNSTPIDTKINKETERSAVPAGGFRAPMPMEIDAKEKGTTKADAPLSTTGDNFLPGISSELLASVEDNSVMRVAENEAWQTVLGVLGDMSGTEVSRASLGFVSFAQLFRQSDVYRGRVVSVRGTIRRAERITTRENKNGITELIRWIVEPAGPSNAPIVIYSLEKPTAFQIGDDLREEATFDGVFFKRWAYAAGDGTRIAPLILAKSANWKAKAAAEPIALPSGPIIVTTLGTLGLFAIGVALLVYRSSIQQHPDVKRAKQYMAGDVEQLDMDDVLPPVEQSLRQLAEESLERNPTRANEDN